MKNEKKKKLEIYHTWEIQQMFKGLTWGVDQMFKAYPKYIDFEAFGPLSVTGALTPEEKEEQMKLSLCERVLRKDTRNRVRKHRLKKKLSAKKQTIRADQKT